MKSESESLLDRVDVLIKLVACALTTGRKQRESIAMLSKAGLAPKDIAALIGTSPNVVRVELNALRKERKYPKSISQGRGNA